jgi:N-acetylmuramoyl-L-alanine amidase
MRAAWTRIAGLVLALVAWPVAQAAPATVQRLEISAVADRTTLVVSLDDPSPYRMFTLSAPDRVVLDIAQSKLGASALPLPAGNGVIRQVRVANRPDGTVRIILELAAQAEPQGAMRRISGDAANRIMVDLHTGRQAAAPLPVASAPPPPAVRAPRPAAIATSEPPTTVAALPEPTPAVPALPEPEAAAPGQPAVPDAVASSEEVTRSAALEGRDIVIAVDAGHGGKDPGAHGPRGVQEKDVTLRIARRLAEIINAEPGMRAVLTRNRDEFVPLRSRMERARAAQADLFVSVHADAVRNRRVQGASVYVLNEKGATDEASRRLAARENAADLIGGVSLGDKDRTLASVLMDLSQNASLSSSIEVADAVLDELDRVGTVRKRRVMQAPFMVLKSPDVPSLLVETAYISNPEEERRLNSHAYRGKLAQAIFSGIRGYFYKNPPRGTLVAELSRRQPVAEVRHVIGAGETLSVIAERYNVSVRRIRDANRLASDRVVVGQVLRIPAVSTS